MKRMEFFWGGITFCLIGIQVSVSYHQTNFKFFSLKIILGSCAVWNQAAWKIEPTGCTLPAPDLDACEFQTLPFMIQTKQFILI
jgi:hypothetical protein